MDRQSTQISATVSSDTKKLLDAYTRRRGVKKSFVIEEALRRHLLAVAETPEEYLAAPVIRVTPESMRRLAGMLDHPAEPTDALRELLRDG